MMDYNKLPYPEWLILPLCSCLSNTGFLRLVQVNDSVAVRSAVLIPVLYLAIGSSWVPSLLRAAMGQDV